MHIFPINIVHGAPDIVVEVLSPETSQYDQVEKKRLYERNGYVRTHDGVDHGYARVFYRKRLAG